MTTSELIKKTTDLLNEQLKQAKFNYAEEFKRKPYTKCPEEERESISKLLIEMHEKMRELSYVFEDIRDIFQDRDGVITCLVCGQNIVRES